MNRRCKTAFFLSLIVCWFPALASPPPHPPLTDSLLPILNDRVEATASGEDGPPPQAGPSEGGHKPPPPAGASVGEIVKDSGEIANNKSQWKPLEEMAIGKGVINADPEQYEAAFEDLMESGLFVSVASLLKNLRTTDRRGLLDLMMEVPVERAYFAGTAASLITEMALAGIKKPLPVSISSLIKRAKGADNEIAVRYLEGLKQGLKKARSDAYSREEYIIFWMEREAKAIHEGLSAFFPLVVWGALGYVLVEDPLTFKDLSDSPKFLSFLTETHPALRGLLSAGGFVATTVAARCGHAFMRRKQFQRIRRELQHHRQSSMEDL